MMLAGVPAEEAVDTRGLDQSITRHKFVEKTPSSELLDRLSTDEAWGWRRPSRS
jgi:hypothetical protein